MVRNARVAVVGGSLGGLTAALLLRELGLDVTVYERSGAELEQRGAGIGFLPASSRFLVERARLDLDELSVSTRYIRYLDRHGRVIHEQDQTYRFSNWNTLYRSLLRCFGRDRYLLGHECIDIRQADGRVQVTEAGRNELEVDLLVCADGVGSRARACLLPDVGPRYAGYVAWRGLVPEQELGEKAAALVDAITYYVYANSHILVYPIPGMDGSVRPNDRLVNFVWYRNYLPGSELTDLMTDCDGKLHEVSLPPGTPRPVHIEEMRATAAARLPELIANVVLAVEAPFLQAILDVEVPRMAFGRVCLVGDAAFVVRPHAAAGTAKAAADAWELAGALKAQPDVTGCCAPVDALISMMRAVKNAAAERGRDPARLITVMRCLVNRTDERLDDATRAVAHGTWEQIAEDVRKMDDAGVDEIFFDVAFQKDAQNRDGLLRYMERFRQMVGAGAGT